MCNLVLDELLHNNKNFVLEPSPSKMSHYIRCTLPKDHQFIFKYHFTTRLQQFESSSKESKIHAHEIWKLICSILVIDLC